MKKRFLSIVLAVLMLKSVSWGHGYGGRRTDGHRRKRARRLGRHGLHRRSDPRQQVRLSRRKKRSSLRRSRRIR